MGVMAPAIEHGGNSRLLCLLFDRVRAAARVDRLPHHCHIVNIQANSSRMKEHPELQDSVQRSEDDNEPYQGAAPSTRLIVAQHRGSVATRRQSVGAATH